MSIRTFPSLAALFALAAPLPVTAQASPPSARVFSLDVSQGDLSSVVQMLERQEGLKAEVRTGPRPYHPIYVHLTGAPLSKVLQDVALSAGAQLTRNTDGSYLFAPKEGALPPSPVLTPIIGPHQVEMAVSFAHASAADIDNLGLPFDSIPLPAAPDSKEKVLKYATGRLAVQLLQTLSRTHREIALPMITTVVSAPTITAVTSAPTITASPGVPATFQVTTQVPLYPQTREPGTRNDSPRQSHALPFQCQGTLTPRINNDGSITVSLSVKVGGASSQSISTVRTVVSGDTLVLAGWQLQDDGTFTPGLSPFHPLHTPLKPAGEEELLIFLTPTIIGDSTDSSKADANDGQAVSVTP